MLLLEANEKHGVDLRVPPQIPPEVSRELLPSTSPASGPSLSSPSPDPVPVSVYPPELEKKMRDAASHFDYRPTHGPPPLHTTGSRALVDGLVDSRIGSHGSPWRQRQQRQALLRRAEWEALRLHQEGKTSEVEPEKTDLSEKESGLRAPETPETAPQASLLSSKDEPLPSDSAVLRSPINSEMRFHCSVCGRAYRQRGVAEEHLLLRHAGQGGEVKDGPGLGEVLAVVTDMAAPPARRKSSAAAETAVTANLSSSPAVRATPEGAARSVKRRLTLSAAVGKGAGKGEGLGSSRLSIKARSQLYANPFGAAADAAAEAVRLEEKEPVNPFVGEKESGPCQEAKSALLENQLFRCPLCLRKQNESTCAEVSVFTCRILDRMLDHIDEAHEEEGGVDGLDGPVLKRLYDQQNYPWRFRCSSASVDRKGEAPGEPSSTSSPTDEKKTPLTTESPLKPSPVLPAATEPSAAPPHLEPLRLHTRQLASTLFRGRVVNIQEGYASKQMTLQIVVCVIGREASIAQAAHKNKTDAESKGGEENISPADEMELVVVRYQGEASSFASLRQTIHVNNDVMISGALRLGRRMDSTSKRFHAYPFVVVNPPFGFIRSLT